MLFGSIAAITHGMGLPLLMIVFGETTDAFSNEFITREVARIIDYNGTVDDVDCTVLNRNCNTTEREECGFIVDGSLCATSEDLVDDINRLVIYYCIFGVMVFIAGWLHTSLFQYACERQLQIIRRRFFHSVLSQEISWFDVNGAGELNARLNE